MWAVVSNEALSVIFKDADAAGLEPDARLTAMWLWTAGAGKTSSNGATATNGNGDVDSGFFGVHAVADTVEASIDVRISSETAPPSPPSTPGTIAWRGTISPQKWMTFYTKVLSRFVNTPGLKLEISFEAAAGREQAKSKGDETRTALRELGLSEDIEIR